VHAHPGFPVDIPKAPECAFVVAKGQTGASPKTEVLQGTLDLMVLQTLQTLGPLHGYGIARRIEQISDDILELNEGTVYASLMRLQHQRWISASWGASDNNRKAKFYASRRRVAVNWLGRRRTGSVSPGSSPVSCAPSGPDAQA